MRVLVACEESQRVCIAFRERGHLAYSCDIKNCTGNHPEWHIKGNVLDYLNVDYKQDPDNGIPFFTCDGVFHCVPCFDLIIAFPPCTYFSRMNFLNYYRKGVFNEKRFEKALLYVDLFNAIWNADCKRICIENPVPFKLFNDLLPPYTMTLQPYEFGENKSKKTCLWLKGLPPLIPTLHVIEHTPLITVNNSFELHKTIEEQSTYRSKTFNGVANAMAEQWGNL